MCLFFLFDESNSWPTVDSNIQSVRLHVEPVKAAYRSISRRTSGKLVSHNAAIALACSMWVPIYVEHSVPWYSLTFWNTKLIYIICKINFLAQTRLWRPSHGGITIPPLTEEMLLKACPEAKGSSPTTGLLIIRLVTWHKEKTLLSSLEHRTAGWTMTKMTFARQR
jgi:hypothetical protein